MRNPTPLAPGEPGFDVTVYLVLNDFGRLGRAYVETAQPVNQTYMANTKARDRFPPKRIHLFGGHFLVSFVVKILDASSLVVIPCQTQEGHDRAIDSVRLRSHRGHQGFERERLRADREKRDVRANGHSFSIPPQKWSRSPWPRPMASWLRMAAAT